MGSQRLTSAKVSLIVIGALTVLKFLFYFFSGSIAVLSEAWHSFSDITTSALVFLAILRSSKKNQNRLNKPKSPKLSRLEYLIFEVHPELKVSLLIGCLLFFVSVYIFWHAFFGDQGFIQRPLMTGIAFIVFSFGSYFLYRFQTIMGKQENSSALFADGIHSRTDMVASALTGLSLIIYHFGVNIDKYVSIIIALFILFFAAEMIINTVAAIIKGKESYYWKNNILNIFLLLFKRINGLGGRHSGRFFKWIKQLIVFFALAFLLSTAIYTVGIQQEAVKTRFGKVINENETIKPGLHLKWPWPFEKIIKINTKKIRSLYIGNKSQNNCALIWTSEHGDDTTFIASDNNFFLPYIIIHYRIKTPYLYVFRHFDPEQLLERSSYKALTEIFTQNQFYDLALFNRKKWMDEAKRKIQNDMDVLKSGLELVMLNVEDLHPPVEIAGSFESVVAAGQESKQLLYEAEKYENILLSEAKGKAFRSLTDAEIYQNEKIKKAQGEEQNYLLRLGGYLNSKTINKTNLFLAEAKKVLENKEKILVEPKTNLASLLLYAEKFIFKKLP